MTWTKGKGVIGLCWETKNSQIADLALPSFTQLADKSAAEWKTLSSQATFGLSHADYQALKAKYGTVIAVPILKNGGAYQGCITLDVPPGVQLTNTGAALETLFTTADLVPKVLRS